MRIYFSRGEEFAERFKRSLGFWVHAFSAAAVVFLILGVSLGVRAFWDDHERLAVILLLTAIGLFGYRLHDPEPHRPARFSAQV